MHQANRISSQLQDKDRGTSVQIDINPDTFTATRNEPLLQSGFRVYRLDDKIVVENVKASKDVRPQRYTLEPGKLNFVTKPNSNYVFFRSSRFQEFLDKYGISRVRSIDPNGEYQGRNGQFKNNIDDFYIVTDGQYTTEDSSSLRVNSEPIFSVRYASSYANVKDASYALVQQVTIKQNDEGKEVSFRIRELVTTGDIYKMEETLMAAVASLDVMIADLLV